MTTGDYAILLHIKLISVGHETRINTFSALFAA